MFIVVVDKSRVVILLRSIAASTLERVRRLIAEFAEAWDAVRTQPRLTALGTKTYYPEFKEIKFLSIEPRGCAIAFTPLGSKDDGFWCFFFIVFNFSLSI